MCVVFAIGLVTQRVRNGNFGRGWFVAATITGVVMTLGTIGASANNTTGGSDPMGGGSLMLVPAILALIAAIRARPNED